MKLTKSQLSLLIRQLIREASPEARATFADDDGPDLGYSAEDEKTKAEKKRKGLSTKIGNSLVPGAKIEIINIRGGKDPEEEAPFMS